MQKPVEDIVKSIAIKYNIHPDQIKEIESIIWEWVRYEMSKGEKNNIDSFESIYLRYLGTFHVKKGMVKYMKENDRKNKEE